MGRKGERDRGRDKGCQRRRSSQEQRDEKDIAMHSDTSHQCPQH
jgi:hypothetical protein